MSVIKVIYLLLNNILNLLFTFRIDEMEIEKNDISIKFSNCLKKHAQLLIEGNTFIQV